MPVTGLAQASPAGLLLAVAAVVLLAACQGSGDPASAAAQSPAARPPPAAGPASTAVPFNDIDSAACLSQAQAAASPTSTGCPGFVLLPLANALDQCTGVGGRLEPIGTPAAWMLDANRDGSPEFLYDLTQNYFCDGAPSVFACGSLGCPSLLYGQKDDAWVVLGYINADDAGAIEVLETTGTSGYASLRGGCGGSRPCKELTHYTWNGESYDRTLIEVGATTVDVAPGGLRTLMAEAAVLAAPTPDAQVLDTYPTGTDVVVIGNVRDSAYRYVSPCNACDRGFLPASALGQ